MTESSPPAEPPRPVVAATPARQGRYGRPVFWVLVISTLLAAIGLLLAWTGAWPGLSRDDAKLRETHAQQAPTFNAPEPAPVTVQQGTDHTAPQKP